MLGFQKRSVFENGAWRGIARFVCSCGATHDEPLNNGRLNPEAIAKRAAAAGWKADAHKPTWAECPACQAKDRSGDKPGETKIMPTTDIRELAAKGTREPTHAERLKIRNMLDQYFDDAAGCWLEGYSDQKAGEEIGVPWALLTRIREAAYGPIRVDPELAALRGEHKRLIDVADKMARDLAKLTTEINAAKARMDDWTNKRMQRTA